ncbi:alpha/beta hydrolase [Streptomyces sp. NBC_00160]|uniref:alpha/beta fold hydrolase n=1 Tax=Streptomyces sp. NBC_00160 TaxID=2903628 RepID=UPI002258091E|nr:alpha/beta hydrolase [Streptomyces sp. NBC_00160]MCX5307472.1 alpha/beta hydrolase [Streptomyces sp. NBC_00160]
MFARRLVRARRASAAAVTLAVSLALCAGAAARDDGDARPVGIGGGRRVLLDCRGSGSPTVVLVSGAGGASDEWTHIADAARPESGLKPDPSAVLPQVARFTRVCAYDRPGTTRLDGTPNGSTPVTQPTSAAAGVRDLRAALAAAGEQPPYVLVGASWGAMIASLFARAEPAPTAGVVTVDGASPFLKDTLTPAQWSAWMDKIRAADPGKGLERPDYPAAVRELRGAPAPPRGLPAVVLTSDHPWDLSVGGGSTWPAWLAAQRRLADDLRARHVTSTDSGHGIAVEQPRLVVRAILDVVGQTRAGQER